ncbi:MAG TPA: hypothetical protein VGI95_00040 [Caulobacteraceae bacterium]|jgi:hypothetical protein
MQSPGSFTKNLGFGDAGLALVYRAMSSGFEHELAPISRKRWRLACNALDNDRQLVVLNFFLCNDGDNVVPDELVRLALQTPYSPTWDRTALFTLNLGQPGVGLRMGIRGSTAWANEFIRNVVATADGTWDYSKIDRGTFDRFLEVNMHATPKSRTKVRSNYLYILELCGITPRRLLSRELDPETWVPSALYVAWDRYMICGVQLDLSLLAAAIRDELHKVAGVEVGTFWDIANREIGNYIASGGIRRFD